MNRQLGHLLPYPFERLRALLGSIPPPGATAIPLHIGEPRHAAPDFVAKLLRETVADSLGRYPATAGIAELRASVARWLERRFGLPAAAVDPETMVIPVSGTREALFSFGQSIIDAGSGGLVAMPNPGYQIYEGTALLAGAEPRYLACRSETGFLPDLAAVRPNDWNRCELLFLCSPGNPTGAVLSRDHFAEALRLAEHYDFVIASDECYSEIYADEAAPPSGLLEVAHAQGRTRFERCIVFHSLSKRSNLPGLRSGFVAGDPDLLTPYRKYRSYHGCAMSVATQRASVAAWEDQAHVRTNREHYRRKFDAVLPVLAERFPVERPAGGFYLWLDVGGDDERFTRELFERTHVTVLPGRYLSRDAGGRDPGIGRVRISLVADTEHCVEAAERIVDFAARPTPNSRAQGWSE
jgi:N-succinyldiaminopimelate aminotransferase